MTNDETRGFRHESLLDGAPVSRFTGARIPAMKNFFLLLLLAGLGYAGWHFRGHLTGLAGKPTTLEEDAAPGDGAAMRPPAPDGAPRPPATPHPAHEAQIAVLKAYPALGLPDSPFHRTFKELHAQARRANPQLLTQPDWPIQLAERTAVALGGGVQPIALPTPPPVLRPMTPPRSALDKLPPSARHKKATPSGLDALKLNP
jgi:hypothetical protein